MSHKNLRLGAAQFDASAGDLPANVAAHERLIGEAGELDVDVLLFPELSLTGYASTILEESPDRCTLDLAGTHVQAIRDACARNGVVAVFGGGLRNPRGLGLSAVVINRNGEICTTYDKQYLDSSEKNWFVRGTSGCMIEVDGWGLGVGICYDSSFPEHGRALAVEGAEVYLVSGAFPLGDSDHRRSIYFPARALENTFFVAFANYVGAHDGLSYCGQSAIYGPDGRVLADAGPDHAGMAVTELEHSTLREARQRNEMLEDRLASPHSVRRVVVH